MGASQVLGRAKGWKLLYIDKRNKTAVKNDNNSNDDNSDDNNNDNGDNNM